MNTVLNNHNNSFEIPSEFPVLQSHKKVNTETATKWQILPKYYTGYKHNMHFQVAANLKSGSSWRFINKCDRSLHPELDPANTKQILFSALSKIPWFWTISADPAVKPTKRNRFIQKLDGPMQCLE
jgi:hypothetical protein